MAESVEHFSVEDYKNLIKFYFDIKELITAAEREDGEQRLSISAITEVRSAFDHIMRAHNVEYQLISEEEIKETTGLNSGDYCRKNYEKAYAHLYRAGYDAYDCIAISMIDRINYLLKTVSRQALHAVIPNVTSSIIKPYKEAKDLFTKAKVQKDVESHDQEKKQFEEYEQANKQLFDIKSILEDHETQLIDYDKELNQKTWLQRLFVVAVAIVAFILGHFIIKK